MSAVNSELKNLNSDMKLVTEQFKGQANSLDALTEKDRILNRQVEQQTEKVRALEEALGQAAEAYGENDKRVDGYHRSLSEARAQLIRMQRELDQNSDYLKEARRSADGAAKSIDGFGKEVKEADNDSAKFSGTVGGIIDTLGKVKGAIAAGAAIGVIKELGQSILEVEENTREFRRIMGTLDVSSQAAGYTTEETAEAFERLYAVLGDEQTAATATANLQALQLSQEDLLQITDMAIGAWATYGDSIPIDGLAEAINETIKAGQVTGTFADVLNWAGGVTEEQFNEALAKASTETERANMVMQLMAEQGLADAANAFFDLNKDITDANESELKMKQAWGELGDALAPVANYLREGFAQTITELAGVVTNLIENLKEAWDWLSKVGNAELAREKGQRNNYYERGAALTTAQLTSVSTPATSAVYADAAAELRAERQYRATGAGGAAGGNFTATITLATEDGRNLGQFVTPFVNEENRANPEVVSDAL